MCNYLIHILVLFHRREIFGTVAKQLEYNNTVHSMPYIMKKLGKVIQT